MPRRRDTPLNHANNAKKRKHSQISSPISSPLSPASSLFNTYFLNTCDTIFSPEYDMKVASSEAFDASPLIHADKFWQNEAFHDFDEPAKKRVRVEETEQFWRAEASEEIATVECGAKQQQPQEQVLVYDPTLVKLEVVDEEDETAAEPDVATPVTPLLHDATQVTTSPQRHEMQNSIASSCSRIVQPASAPVRRPISMHDFKFSLGTIRTQSQDKTNELRTQKESFIQNLEQGVSVLQDIFKSNEVLLNDTDIWRVCKCLPSILKLVEECKKRQDRIAYHPGFSLQCDILHLKQKKRTNHSSVYFDKDEEQYVIVFKREVLVCVYFNDIDLDSAAPVQWFFSEPNLKQLTTEQIHINNTEKRLEFVYAFEKQRKSKTQALKHMVAIRDKRGKLHEAKFEMEIQGYCDAQYRKKIALLEKGVDAGNVIRKCQLEEIQLKVAKTA